MSWIAQHAELIFCIVGCMLVTAIPRMGPVMFLQADSLPPALRHWLSFVPVSVMEALLGQDIFFYNGVFSLSWTNLYLVAAVPSLLVAWRTQSFFGTIAMAMGFVAAGRALGVWQ